jgi:hypothetical protein
LKELSNEQIGVSIKKQIEDVAAQNNTNPNQPLLESFASVALQVALVQYDEWGRGIILGIEKGQQKDFLYVPLANTSVALWMASVEFKREVTSVLQQYDPTKEAVIVMAVPPTVQLFVAQPSKMNILTISDVILTPISLPPAINVRKEQDGSYFCFVFTHKELGKLGRIVLIPHPATGQTEIKCEIVQNSGFSLDAKKREEIFYPLAKELIARMEIGLAK